MPWLRTAKRRASSSTAPESESFLPTPNKSQNSNADFCRGVPYYAILITASVALLTFMSTSTGASTVFTWFQNLTTIASLFTWMAVSIAYIRFHAALKAQGISRNTLVFKSKYQPYTAYFSLAFFGMITLLNGFYTFPSPTKKFDLDDFITAYVGIPIFAMLYLVWKVLKGTRFVPAAEADIQTGKAALDAADAHWPERQPRNVFEKIWYWIA